MHKQLRATWHDYNSRCIYMITLNKSGLCGHFGTLAGSLSVPSGQMGAPYVKPSAIGIAIKEALRRMGEIEPAAKIIQYVLMPDHIHFLLFVQEPTTNPLGKTIARFKVLANKLAAVEQVFAEGFNDQILMAACSFHPSYLRPRNPYAGKPKAMVVVSSSLRQKSLEKDTSRPAMTLSFASQDGCLSLQSHRASPRL